MGIAISLLQGACGYDSVEPGEEATESIKINNNSTEQELIKLEKPIVKQEVHSKVPSGVKKTSNSDSDQEQQPSKHRETPSVTVGSIKKEQSVIEQQPVKSKEINCVLNTHTASETIIFTSKEEISGELPATDQCQIVPSAEVLPFQKKINSEKKSTFCAASDIIVDRSLEVVSDISHVNSHCVTTVGNINKVEQVQFVSHQELQEIVPTELSAGQFRTKENIVTYRVLDLNISENMEGIDTFASEQVDIDKVQLAGEIDTEELNALMGQLTAQREASPDDEDDAGSDTGSMQASTGSEGLEEQLNSNLVISDNAESKSNGEPEQERPKQEQSTKSEQKSGTKEKSKEEKSSKSKKKEDKTIDHILRALNSLQSTEEKLAALCKKYADLHEDHRILQSTMKQSQRKLTVVTREKDQLQSEHTKAVMAKSKLESLCRELQKHNQVIRQESLQRAREEDEKRKEISNKFQTTIGEIQQQMQDHHERNIKLREENQELAGKLKQFIEQYETREKQIEKVMQHRELEQKLADAKIQQANAMLTEEQERGKKEKELLFLQAAEGQKKATLLEAQLGMYKERYEEFQSTINKSNDMFQKFKTEMDKMTKRIKKLEKEGAAWKSKWEKSNKALIEMAEEKTNSDKEKTLLANKIQKLESLCRAMQAERLGRKVIEASGLDLSKLEGDSVQSASNPSSDHLPATDAPSQAGGGAEGDMPSHQGADKADTETCPADSTTKESNEICDCPSDSGESNQSDNSGGSEAANEQLSDEQNNQPDATSVIDDQSSQNQIEPVESSQT